MHSSFPEEILVLLSDTTVAIEAQRTAHPAFWQNCVSTGTALQGTTTTEPIYKIDLDLTLPLQQGHGWQCTCSHPKPCLHAISLFLLWQQHPQHFLVEPGKSADATAGYQPPTAPDQLDLLREGTRLLDRWLTDIIRLGLARPMIRTFEFWNEMADHLLAGRLPGLSQWISEVAVIAVRRHEWIQPVLEELSLLYLVTQSAAHFESLLGVTQADLYTAVGWNHLASESLPLIPLEDEWRVVGQQHRFLRDQTPEQFIWLLGIHSRRPAVLHSIGADHVIRNHAFNVGDVIAATLLFTPSRAPLKARLATDALKGRKPDSVQGARIEEILEQFSAFLTQNPWTRHYPCLLENVYVERFDKGWILRHADGTFMPIAEHFNHQWVLHVAGGGRGFHVAGTWDGHAFFPLSIMTKEETIDFSPVLRYPLESKKPFNLNNPLRF